MNNQLVSICIPTYNGAKFLQESLDSVNAQSYKNIEVIISDDNSTDDTIEICRKFKENTQFPVHIYAHQPQGIGANWNHCIEKAKGEYIKFLFQDDILYNSCIEEMVEIYTNYPDLGLVACKRDFIIDPNMKSEQTEEWIRKYKNLQIDYELFNDSVYYLSNTVFGKKSFLASPLNKIGEPSCVMFRRDITKSVGLFDLQLKQILDYEYWYRILKNNPIIVINKSLVAFRIHENQATNLNRAKEINDYNTYHKILYRDYFHYLHDSIKRSLDDEFSKSNMLKKYILKKYKSLKSNVEKWLK